MSHIVILSGAKDLASSSFAPISWRPWTVCLLLGLMADNPNYGDFTLGGQTVILEDDLEVRPDREQDLRDLVSAGRILVGPWYVMQDEFLVSGESLIRNLLEGQRTAARFSPVNGGRLRSRPFRPHSPTAPSAPWLRHRVSSP